MFVGMPFSVAVGRAIEKCQPDVIVSFTTRLPLQATDREHSVAENAPRQQRGQDQVIRRDQAARVEFGLLTTGMLTQAFVLRLDDMRWFYAVR